MSEIPARLGLMQRVLPEYRLPFFEMLAAACPQGFSLFSGDARPEESIQPAQPSPSVHHFQANNQHLLSGRFYALRQKNWREWLQSWNLQVLIQEANPRYLTSPAAARWMRRKDRPVIGWGLGAPAGSGMMRSFWRAYLRQFDALITYSRTGFEQYRQMGVDPREIFIAPNAAAPKPQQPPAPRPDHYAEGRAVLLFVGRLQARKRVDVLLQACAALPDALQPELWIVGDGPEKQNLETQAQTLYPRVCFYGGKFGNELTPLFQAADVFVLPGTGGLAVQQAMSHGLPVIVGEADGTQADLVRPENGVLVQPGSVDSLRATLEDLLSQPQRLRRMGDQSYRIVSEEINLENMVDVFSQAVRFVLER